MYDGGNPIGSSRLSAFQYRTIDWSSRGEESQNTSAFSNKVCNTIEQIVIQSTYTMLAHGLETRRVTGSCSHLLYQITTLFKYEMNITD